MRKEGKPDLSRRPSFMRPRHVLTFSGLHEKIGNFLSKRYTKDYESLKCGVVFRSCKKQHQFGKMFSAKATLVDDLHYNNMLESIFV